MSIAVPISPVPPRPASLGGRLVGEDGYVEEGPLEIELDEELRVWPERKDLWVYVRVPDDHTMRLDEAYARRPRGFRSIPVLVTLGGQEWKTGLFRYRDGSWALPLKKQVRRRHGLEVGHRTSVHLVVTD